MKNTLAENMLRFGPKNLTQENRENLKRLTEDFINPNDGMTYKSNFKNVSMFDKYVKGDTAVPNSVLLPPPGVGINTEAHTQLIWYAAAYTGEDPSIDNVRASASQIKRFLINVWKPNMKKKLIGTISNSDLVKFLDDETWWDTEITNPANPKENITRWNMFVKKHLLPYLSAKKALVL